MIIYEGRFPVGTFVKHRISKDIYFVRAISIKDKIGKSIHYTLTNGIVNIDVMQEEIEIATEDEILEANQFREEV